MFLCIYCIIITIVLKYRKAYKGSGSMKIVAIYGSARKNGNCAAVVDTTLELLGGDAENTIKRYHLADMEIKPCLGCFSCRKKEGCVHEDEMNDLFWEIVNSDFVIFSSPVYCMDISGPFKMMYDRLYPTLGGEPGAYKPRYPGKKCMLILSQGAPRFMFRSVPRRVKKTLKMNGFDNVATVVSDLSNPIGAARKNVRLHKQLERICKKIKQG